MSREWATPLKDVSVPMESYGECRLSRICKNYSKTILGSGLCVTCWDLGRGNANWIEVKE
jgi:hypothetical protein